MVYLPVAGVSYDRAGAVVAIWMLADVAGITECTSVYILQVGFQEEKWTLGEVSWGVWVVGGEQPPCGVGRCE